MVQTHPKLKFLIVICSLCVHKDIYTFIDMDITMESHDKIFMVTILDCRNMYLNIFAYAF